MRLRETSRKAERRREPLRLLLNVPFGRCSGMSAVHRTEALLRKGLSDPIDLRTVATREGISEYALIRAFRRCYAITPIQHLISLRTERACGLLAAGELPADAAQEAGFADQAHLTRAFKQRMGTTPAAYRKMVHVKGNEGPLQ